MHEYLKGLVEALHVDSYEMVDLYTLPCGLKFILLSFQIEDF